MNPSLARAAPAAAALAAAALGLLAACGGVPAHRQGSARPHQVPVASAAPTQGLLPASRKLSDRLVLARTRAVAGRPVTGMLIVVNHGSRPLNLTRGCQPQYVVVLTNRRFPPRAAFPMICLDRPFLIKPGENRLRFTVQTAHPAGRYEAVLVGDGLALPAPAPVAVTLLPRAGG